VDTSKAPVRLCAAQKRKLLLMEWSGSDFIETKVRVFCLLGLLLIDIRPLNAMLLLLLLLLMLMINASPLTTSYYTKHL
jgi:hypothetical protein